ncbi:unnamed protein product [Colias eurytheme]|nr:unnamed protein product [Colias eurytheme]
MEVLKQLTKMPELPITFSYMNKFACFYYQIVVYSIFITIIKRHITHFMCQYVTDNFYDHFEQPQCAKYKPI